MTRRPALPVATALILMSGCAAINGTAALPTKLCGISATSGWAVDTTQTDTARGLAAAAEHLGLDVTRADSDSAHAAEALGSLIGSGCTVIVAEGADIAPAITATARAHSDRTFLLTDADAGTASGAEKAAAPGNVSTVLTKETDAAYLAGFTAAGVTTTGNIAVVSGIETSGRKALIDAFAQGISAYNQAYGTSISLKGWDSARGRGSFTGHDSADSLRDAAARAYADGSDIVLAVAGSANSGVRDAIQAAGNQPLHRMIWVGVGAPETPAELAPIITSITSTAATRIDEAIRDLAAGKTPTQRLTGTLKNHGVTLGDFGGHAAAMSPDLLEAVNTLRAEIDSGTLKIATVWDPQSFGGTTY